MCKSQEHIATLEKEVSAANAAVARADVRLAETRAEATRATEIVSMLEADAAKAQSRIATLEKEAATAKAALADADARVAEAKAQATRATETVSMLEADGAKAQSRIATLENEIASAKAHSPNADAKAAPQGGEQERTAVLEKAATAAKAERAEAETQAVDARLALEKLKERRILGLEQQARITAALIGYAGQEYTLSVASGSEAENLLCEIDAALSAAQWKRIPSPHSITVNTKCGNASLNGLSGLSVRLSEKADTEHQWNMLMLVNALRAEGIAVDGSIDGEDASPTAIAVTVGIKPY
jgi:chromosome segregation ATPase